MTKSIIRFLTALAALTLAASGVRAEDIDIYGGVGGTTVPNVLIIVDNTSSNDASYSSTCPYTGSPANLPNGKLLDMVYCSLYGVAEIVKTQPSLLGKLNVGLMSGGSGSNKGGSMYYPSASPYTLPLFNAANIGTFESIIQAGIPKATGNAKLDGDMTEAWAFYAGKTGPRSGTSYSAHIGTQSCQKSFIIIIGAAAKNGRPCNGSGCGSASELAASGATAAQQVQINTSSLGSNTGDDSSWVDEWARFLYQTDFNNNTNDVQNIITYTIAAGGTDPDYVQILKSTANVGGGKAFVGSDYASMTAALLQIFNEVAAVNSVFASSTLPISSNANGSFQNQVFTGMFRPDGNGAPRWMGNLKQYQFALSGSPPNQTLYLADSTGTGAISGAGTGFIAPTAVSFWTSKDTSKLPDSIGGFWVNNPQGSGGGYDSPDGQIVEKGGVGERLRLDNLQDVYTAVPGSTNPRNVYTCTSACLSGSSLSATKFDTTNTDLTAAALGVASPTNLIRWVRGSDNVGDEASPGNGITTRPSVHGDVIHSRPAAINYGGTTGVVVFYGANDGTYRAVNGNQTASIGSASPGSELWSFVPTEFFTKLNRLYTNSPLVKFASTPTGLTPTPTAKDYFFDGSTGVWQNGSMAWIYLTARRGGKLLYALDVSTPTNPVYKWKITNSTTGFGELGQTWSTPKVAKVKGNTNPVVIFGAGYDPNQDNDPPTSGDTQGRGIYIVDAFTGALVWSAVYSSGGSAGACSGTTCGLSDMTYSIPADVTLVDTDWDGYIDRLYAADTGGNIWRVDLEPTAGTAPSNWKATKFAALGGTGSGPKRKFFYSPDVVITKNFDMVLAGTGDHEHPLYNASATSSYAVVNRFYALKDTVVGKDASGWTTITDASSSTANNSVSGLTDATSTPYVVTTANNGFYVSFATNAGEKVVNAPTTIGGFTYFGTNTPPVPTSTACTNLGTARGYQINFLTGATVSGVVDGGGLLPSPVAGVVNVTQNGTSYAIPFLLGPNPAASCSGPDCRSPIGASRPPIPVPPTRKRAYWYIDKHDN